MDNFEICVSAMPFLNIFDHYFAESTSLHKMAVANQCGEQSVCLHPLVELSLRTF